MFSPNSKWKCFRNGPRKKRGEIIWCLCYSPGLLKVAALASGRPASFFPNQPISKHPRAFLLKEKAGILKSCLIICLPQSWKPRLNLHSEKKDGTAAFEMAACSFQMAKAWKILECDSAGSTHLFPSLEKSVLPAEPSYAPENSTIGLMCSSEIRCSVCSGSSSCPSYAADNCEVFVHLLEWRGDCSSVGRKVSGYRKGSSI